MKRTYELQIERRIVDTFRVEASSRTDAAMKLALAINDGAQPTSSMEIRRTTLGAPSVVEQDSDSETREIDASITTD